MAIATKDPREFVKEIAKQSEHKKIKSGIVIVSSKGVIIGAGSSQPDFNTFGKFKCAPVGMIALQSIKLRGRIGMSSVYIYAEDSEGNPVSAKPEKETEDLFYQHGIVKIIYRNEKGWEEINLLQRNGGAGCI